MYQWAGVSASPDKENGSPVMRRLERSHRPGSRLIQRDDEPVGHIPLVSSAPPNS
jgi:hypothetical protein